MRHLHYSKCFLLIISPFFLLATVVSAAPIGNKPPLAVQGHLDLNAWHWETNGVLPLNGEWEFFWNELLFPDDFSEGTPGAERNYITLPRAWNNYLLNNQTLTGNGYATYRLTIAHQSNEILALKIPRIFTAYRLWANGHLIAAAGQFRTQSEQFIPQYLPQVQYFKPQTGTTELIIQVANFRHRSGGILESLLLGTASQISAIRDRNLAFDLFLFGSLFIIGCYHLILFFFRTKDKSTLYFGIYTLLISARTILVSEIFFINLYPDFSWEIAHKIQTLAYYWGVPLVVLFLKSAFPQDISDITSRIIQMIAAGFGFLVLLTPARFFTNFNPIYQVFSLLVILYLICRIVHICYKKRPGAYPIGFGFLVLILFALNDIIFYSVILADADGHFLRRFITRGNLSSWGLLFSVFVQSITLARKFSSSFLRVELLSKQLQDLNVTLEKKVAARTLALESSKAKLKTAYQAVTHSEKKLQDLMQNISHDLRTPLSVIKGYVNAIIDGTIQDPELAKKYLQRVDDKINHLNRMVQDLLDLSRLHAGKANLSFIKIPVNTLIETIAEKSGFELPENQKLFHLRINYPPGWPDADSAVNRLYVKVDPEKIERVIANLLSNAFKYTTPGGQIDLTFKITTGEKELQIIVADTGIGISPEEQAKIFDRFYRISKARQSEGNNLGLGLAIVKEMVAYHGGRVWVESTPGVGSVFTFALPVYPS